MGRIIDTNHKRVSQKCLQNKDCRAQESNLDCWTVLPFLYRLLWAVLVTQAFGCCVYFCMETYRAYFTFPTKTIISTSATGAKFPDVTICNHNGFDAAVLKSLSGYLHATENKNVNDSKFDNWPYVSENFEKSVISLYNKYELFLKKYAENKQFSLEIQNHIQNLKSVFNKHKLSSVMTNEEILTGAVPTWQILVWCQYGELPDIIITLTAFKESDFYNVLTI